MGLNVDRLKTSVLIVATLLAAAVSVSGVIGFVGLVVPHMIRLITGSDYRVIVPLSALGGAVFMVWCDTAARSVLAPTEIPLGVVTAFIGAPFFAYLLYRNKKAQGGFIMITAQGLGKAYGKVPILEGVDLHIAEGEWWGSSVRTEAVNPPSCDCYPVWRVPTGSVTLRGKELGRYTRKALARIVAVLQQEGLDPTDFTVREVLEMGRFPF